jgi:hypothetical protein
MLDTCLSSIEQTEKLDSSIQAAGTNGVGYLFVSISKPVPGSEIDQTQMKGFKISKLMWEKIGDSLGFPVLKIKVKSEGSLIAEKNFDTRCSLEVSRELGLSRIDLFSEKLVNEKKPHVRTGISRLNEFQTYVKNKFIESNPKDAAFGSLRFAYPSAGLELKVEEYGRTLDYATPTRLPRESKWARSTFLVPEAVIHGVGRSGVLPAVQWRAPRPGAVAFPIVLDLPIEQTKNPLELEAKVFADFTKVIK